MTLAPEAEQRIAEIELRLASIDAQIGVYGSSRYIGAPRNLHDSLGGAVGWRAVEA